MVVVDLAGERRAAAVAADLARQAGAHLTGLAIAFDPTMPVYTIAAPIPTEFIAAAHEQGIEEAKAALSAFEKIGEQAGVSVETRLSESMSGDGFVTVVRNAIACDLAVIGQDNADAPESARESVIEALLFQAGIPTLVVPYAGVSAFNTGRVVVAWDGSSSAGRAVRAAMPMLAMADEILVTIVNEGQTMPGEPGADIGAYLARHDLDVNVRVIDNLDDAGKALLAFAARENADWMVMGAYGHSRLRQFLLGGATHSVLSDATLPVLMVH
jgi:nucleotide-binding universal stress UspA family protein